jgi:DNA-binding beta-propeller fold protein YncE
MPYRIAALAALLAAAPIGASVPTYSVTGTISAGDGGWDYSSIDPETNKMFIGRGDSITAIDLATGKSVDKFAPAQRAHAALPIPGTGALLETDGNTNSVRLIDTRTGNVRWSLPSGEKPDSATWDAASKRAIVMHNKGGTIAFVDVANAKVIGSIAVAAGLEGAIVDNHGLVWVNSEETNKVYPIDVNAMKVLAPIDLKDCEGATGIVYSAKHDQFVTVCGSGYAYVIDAKAKTLISRFPIGKGADYALIDEKRGFVAVPCGEGILSFFDLTQNAIVPAGSIKTEKGARSGAIDPATGNIYLPTARFDPPKAPGERRTLVPGSFHVLVVSAKS